MQKEEEEKYKEYDLGSDDTDAPLPLTVTSRVRSPASFHLFLSPFHCCSPLSETIIIVFLKRVMNQFPQGCNSFMCISNLHELWKGVWMEGILC